MLQLATTAVLLVLGLAFFTGVSFARSACRRVFNREPPPGLLPGLLLPMLRVLRPFGMLWRLATAPLRCRTDGGHGASGAAGPAEGPVVARG